MNLPANLTLSSPMLTPNTIFYGNIAQYQVGDLLASGATSVVFAAHPVQNEILKVVIKVMKPDKEGVSVNLDAFRREIDILNDWQKLARQENAATLLHLFQPPTPFALANHTTSPLPTPYLVEHRTTGTLPYYIVMERVDGVPIAKNLSETGTPLDEKYAIQVAYQFTTLLHLLHTYLERSFTDLKLENLWWHRSGRLMVTDWNVLSEKGKVDVERDMRNWGQIFYLLLTGVPIEEHLEKAGIPSATLTRQGGTQWAGLSSGIRTILTRWFAIQPALRYSSMQALAEDLACLHHAWNDSVGDFQTNLVKRLYREGGVEAATWILEIATQRHLSLPSEVRIQIEEQIKEQMENVPILNIDQLRSHLRGYSWDLARELVRNHAERNKTVHAQLMLQRWLHFITLAENRLIPNDIEWLKQVLTAFSHDNILAVVAYLVEGISQTALIDTPHIFVGLQSLQKDSEYQTSLNQANESNTSPLQKLDLLEKAYQTLAALVKSDSAYGALLAEVVPFPQSAYIALQDMPAVKEEKERSKLNEAIRDLDQLGSLSFQSVHQLLDKRAEIAKLKQLFREFPDSRELRTELTQIAGQLLQKELPPSVVQHLLDVAPPSFLFPEHSMLRNFVIEIQYAYHRLEAKKWSVSDWTEWQLLLDHWHMVRPMTTNAVDNTSVSTSMAVWVRPWMRRIATIAVDRWRILLETIEKNDTLWQPASPERITLEMMQGYLELVEDSVIRKRAQDTIMNVMTWIDYRLHPWKSKLEKIDNEIKELSATPCDTLADVKRRLRPYEALRELNKTYRLSDDGALPTAFRELLEEYLQQLTHLHQQSDVGTGIAEQLQVLLEQPRPSSINTVSPLAALNDAAIQWQTLKLKGFEQLDDVRQRFRTAILIYIESQISKTGSLSLQRAKEPLAATVPHDSPSQFTLKEAITHLKTLLEELNRHPLPYFNENEAIQFRNRVEERIRVYRQMTHIDGWFTQVEKRLPSLSGSKSSLLLEKIGMQELYFLELALNEANARLQHISPPAPILDDGYEWWRKPWQAQTHEYATFHQQWTLLRNQQLDKARRTLIEEAQRHGEALYTVATSTQNYTSESVTPEVVWRIIGQWGAHNLKIKTAEGLKVEAIPTETEWFEFTRTDAAIITFKAPMIVVVNGLEPRRWYEEVYDLIQLLEQHLAPSMGNPVTDGRYLWGKLLLRRTGIERQYKGRLLFQQGGIQMPGFSGRKTPIEITILVLRAS